MVNGTLLRFRQFKGAEVHYGTPDKKMFAVVEALFRRQCVPYRSLDRSPKPAGVHETTKAERQVSPMVFYANPLRLHNSVSQRGQQPSRRALKVT
jgi:hypothetical protein